MLRYVAIALGLLVLCAPPSQGETLIIDPDRVFSSAAEAYESGDYDRAVELYLQLLDAGYQDKAVTFNLGNAHFRSKDIGRAVLNYRKAWRQAPRDADILTNLEHVQDEAHLVAPETGALERILQTLRPGEWAAGLTLALWAGALCFGISLYRPEPRLGLQRCALGCVLVMLVAGAGLWQWQGFSQRQEAVVISKNQQVKYGPLAAARPHFDVPPGTIVRVKDRSEGWLQVTLNGKSGWISESACAIVSQ